MTNVNKKKWKSLDFLLGAGALPRATCGDGYERLPVDAARVAAIRNRRRSFVPGQRVFWNDERWHGTGDEALVAIPTRDLLARLLIEADLVEFAGLAFAGRAE